MKTVYEAEFPGCHMGQVTRWRFEWNQDGFAIHELSRDLKLTLNENHTSLFPCDAFAEHMENRLPHGLSGYLIHLWEEIEAGHFENGIQTGFDSLGQWCIACEQAIPSNEYWEEYNGRINGLKLARK